MTLALSVAKSPFLPTTKIPEQFCKHRLRLTMGCCFSRSSGPNSPYPGGAANASARHINPPPLTLPESVQAGSQVLPRRRHRDQGPLDEHINKPLRRHVWTSADRQWTKQQLDNERAEFFDTRVTGRSEIWQTIRAAVAVLQEPGGESSDALATTQSILSAAEISLPTGDLANGVYDSLGNYYQLPQWVVSDPSNLATLCEGVDMPDMSTTGDDDTAEEEVDPVSLVDDSERRRHEKGKEVIDGHDQITLRARLSETGRDFEIHVSKSDTVRNIIRKLACEASTPGVPFRQPQANIAYLKLPTEKKIRIAYMGKMLKDNQPLEIQGWQTGHVVNALVFNRE